ncbi:hypothetical protein [Bartonella sp. TS82HLJMH]|uniref:hypothetical protein n=1 Tax=Bartonella sp. TS82HLJMH TaxID=3243577 RepID=UPI0035CF8216
MLCAFDFFSIRLYAYDRQFDFSAYSTPNIVFAVGLFPIGMAIMQFFLLSHWVAEDNGNGVEAALGVGMAFFCSYPAFTMLGGLGALFMAGR